MTTELVENKYDKIKKARAVIASCVTKVQLTNAEKYCFVLVRQLYGDHNYPHFGYLMAAHNSLTVLLGSDRAKFATKIEFQLYDAISARRHDIAMQDIRKHYKDQSDRINEMPIPQESKDRLIAEFCAPNDLRQRHRAQAQAELNLNLHVTSSSNVNLNVTGCQ